MGGVLVASVVAAGLVVVPNAGAASSGKDWSEKDPPPICQSGADCIRQPLPFISAGTAQPIRIDRPVMSRVPSENAGETTWQVTFSARPAAPNADMVMRPVSWADPIQLVPIAGRSDPLAGVIYLSRSGRCAGALACTYVTSQLGLYGGWYRAGYSSAGLVSQTTCPVSTGNGSFGCGDTFSEGAAYLPTGSDLVPPKVALRVAGRGLTTKAVAAARDPYGKALSLTWDFGDGTVVAGSFGKVIAHRYARAAEYEVTARVRTSDGRSNAVSADAGVVPPAPVLQAVGRVGNGPVVAAGVLPGWPAGIDAAVHYWTTGCPTNPTAALDSSAYLAFPQPVHADHTVSAQGSVDPAANAFVLEASGYVPIGGGQVAAVQRVSKCLSSIATASTTTAAVTAGATTVPVSAPGVLTGDVAVVDAGATAAEQRLVDGAGLLLHTALAAGHAQGAYVLDAGRPLPPYVVPAPPADPKPPIIPGPPGKPTITKVTVVSKTKVKLSVRAGATNGRAITKYTAKCTSDDGGRTRTGSAARSPITVGRLTSGKHYRCVVRATNSLGTGPYSTRSRRFRA